MQFIKGYSNREEITKLWKTVFGDSEEYINTFLNNYFQPEFCYMAVEDGTAVSMLMALPVALQTATYEYDGRYIYAVSTHLSYRGRGISRKLTLFSEEEIKKDGGEFTCLVPAEKSLFNFYKAGGYKDFFYRSIKEYHLNNIVNNCELKPIKMKFSQHCDFRNNYLSKSGAYAKWQREFLDYLQIEAQFQSGAVLSFGEGYVVCYPREDNLLIKEICAEEKYKEQIIYTALKYYNKESALVCDIAKDDLEKHPFGMIKILNDKININESTNFPIISLVLD